MHAHEHSEKPCVTRRAVASSSDRDKLSPAPSSFVLRFLCACMRVRTRGGALPLPSGSFLPSRGPCTFGLRAVLA